MTSRASSPSTLERSRSLSRLATRVSIFGGSLSTRDETRHDVVEMARNWRQIKAEPRLAPPPANANPKKEKKRTLKDIAEEAMAKNENENGSANANNGSAGDRPVTERRDPAPPEPRHPRPAGRPATRRKASPRPAPSFNTAIDPGPWKPTKLTFKGTFYGSQQPECALQPIRVQNYDDESDLEDLIDDGDEKTGVSDDGTWAAELAGLLGSYAERDFSAVDRARNYKMQASTEEILNAEAVTAKIGREVDRRERKKIRAEERREVGGGGGVGRRKHRHRLVVLD